MFLLFLSVDQVKANDIKYYLIQVEKYKDNNTDSTLHYLNKALSISNDLDDLSVKINVLIQYAKFDIQIGDFEDAYIKCNNASEISDNSGIKKYDLEILMYTGLSYSNLGLYSEALPVFISAQKLYSKHPPNYLIKSELDYYTAMVYLGLSDNITALEYIKSSISNNLENKDTIGAFKSYIFMTKIYNNVDSLNKYFSLAFQVLKTNPQLKYKKVVYIINKAIFLSQIGKNEESKKLCREGIELAKEGGYNEYLAFLYNNFAYRFMFEARYDSSKFFFDKAYDLSKELENLDLESEVLDSYSDYYSRIGDYKNSLKYSKLYIEKSNELREHKKLKETRFLSAVYENEKKENAILKQQNEINKLWIYVIIALVFLVVVMAISIYFRQRWALSKSKLETTKKTKKLEIAEAKIQGQDAERDRLGMDLHDGIVADLSALKMRIQSYFKENDEFTTVNHSLNTIIQNLRGLSHRMRPASLEEYGLVPSIQNLVYTVNQSNNFKVDFYCDFDDRLSQNIEVSIYFLIYELVNNATKYSSGDTIDIQLYRDKELINLSVEDNGGGFNPENKNAGQGLKNIRDRLAQLGGNLVIDSHDDATAFIINIPIK